MIHKSVELKSIYFEFYDYITLELKFFLHLILYFYLYDYIDTQFLIFSKRTRNLDVYVSDSFSIIFSTKGGVLFVLVVLLVLGALAHVSGWLNDLFLVVGGVIDSGG